MAAGGLIIGILCGLTAALLAWSSGAGWLLAGAAYTVFGSAGLIMAMLAVGGASDD